MCVRARVTASLPANSVKELIDLARASPGKLNVASRCRTPTTSAAQLMTLTGIELVHVPYKGSSLGDERSSAGKRADHRRGCWQLLPSTGRTTQDPRRRIRRRLKTYRTYRPSRNQFRVTTTPLWGIVGRRTPKAIVDNLNAIMNKAPRHRKVLQRSRRTAYEVATTTRKVCTT